MGCSYARQRDDAKYRTILTQILYTMINVVYMPIENTNE